jgi:ubiquinone/menaquinone biosynthesis C-methylase UbiE
MKMSPLEKHFVNAKRHSTRVAQQAEARLQPLEPQPGQRLLDVGCGNGAAIIQLAHAYGLDVTGVDIDPDQIAAAQLAAGESNRMHFLGADATELPFDEHEFDFVYTNKTTHHIRDWPRALAEMARVLKPGGALVYADFVAPVGRHLPTRRGIEAIAGAHELQLLQRKRTAIGYRACYRKQA